MQYLSIINSECYKVQTIFKIALYGIIHWQITFTLTGSLFRTSTEKMVNRKRNNFAKLLLYFW